MPAKKSEANKSRKYSPRASNKVGKAIREAKKGTLRSGNSGEPVTSRKQAIAIGLSEARREGAKVPRNAGRSSTAKKKAGAKKR
jgi:hypothetical protein